MLESEPESPVEKNFPQPKIGSKRSDLGSYTILNRIDGISSGRSLLSPRFDR